MKSYKLLAVLFSLVLIWSLPFKGFAQSAPSLINYQGKLTDASGSPLPNGTYGVAFRIWTKKDSTVQGDTLIWGQEYNVALVSGVFNVILGGLGTPVPGAAVNDIGLAFFEAERYVALTVARGTNGAIIANAVEIVPRQRLLSTPFAMSASVAGSVPDGSITGAKIAAASIGSAQLVNGAVGSAQLAPGTLAFVPRNIQIFTSSGIWTNTGGASTVYVKVIGRGGNGGDANNSRPRGGGGGGGYAEGPILVTGNVTVTIGAINSFAGTTTIQATSGGDGSGYAGGAGGTGTGGAINLRGGAGQNVSETVNGTGGMGGASAMGAGGTGGSLSGGTAYLPAGPGANFGGGGGGATNEPKTGGTGDPGAVIIYY